ncbi:pilus assembly protein [Cellulomonas sp. S1-8]|uniref:pilus assembly protein n=1 Tax=Cellulomonas sp. S1-8 TaxID=2904790 RepID=UPI0022437AEF|nr:pilus assembly protein [Cellulomonas sp. S1-8]UZN04615.1 pilus assembly protein [Cellulomonas sp. S1-8]
MSCRVRRWWRARTADRPGDAGSALVEFLGISVVLLVPIVYLVLVLGRIQAATFAAESAAREAARVYVAADDAEQGAARAVTSVAVALTDQGFDDDPAEALDVRCSADPCLTPGAEVAATVQVRVPLPFVPSFVRDVVPLEVPVTAQRVAPVDTYRVAR